MRPAEALDAASDAPSSPSPSAADRRDSFAVAALEPLAAFGPFDLLGEAGRGGQGIVYRARRRGDGSILAIKRLTAARRLSERLRARFEREWEAARRLDHPGIVRPLDAELVHGEMVIAMEWVEGVTITRWADGEPGAGPRRSPRECVVAIAAAVDAVVHAHQRGVIHRDLKPSNILVGPDGRPRILDFGLAKLLDDAEHSADAPSLTGPDEAIGTIPYAAPEQILAGASHADTRADVYALGAVLYRMLTGHPPHRTDGPLADVLRSLQNDPPRPSALAPAVDRELEAVVLRALRRAPGERYQSADALAADLRRYLAGEPVHARPPRFAAHLRSLVRRHRVASASAAGLLAGVLIFGAVSGVLALRLAAERRAVLHSAARASAAAQESSIALDAVREMLASARPTESGGDTTVIELLGRAAEQAQSRLEAHPAAGAEVAYTIGYTYRSLWMWRESVPHLERALELGRLAHGPESEPVARSMVALGTSLSNLRDERAVSLQREALRLRRLAVPPDPSLVSESLMRLGYALHRAAQAPQWDEAEACLREALQWRRAAHGETHPSVAECLHHLGYLRWRQHRGPEAIALYREASQIFRAAGAAASAEHAECLTGLASILAQTADHPAAIATYQELIPLTRALYGRWQTLAPILQLADSLESTGDRHAAAERFAEAARIRADKLIIDSPDIAHSIGRLLSVLTAHPDCAPAVAESLHAVPPGALLQLEPALRGLARSWRGDGRTEAAAQLDRILPAEQGSS